MNNAYSVFRRFTLVLISLPLLLAGCVRDDNNDCPATYSDLEVVAHWPEGATVPSAIRVVFYSVAGGNSTIMDLPPQGGKISIRTGTYSILVLNSDTQRILYSNRGSYNKYDAYTSTVGVSIPGYPNITTCFVSPDDLWLESIDSYRIRKDTKVIDVYPEKRVYQYYIVAEMEGIEYVKSAAGVVTNLKESILLHDCSANVVGTVQLQSSRIPGAVLFAFKSFGVETDKRHEIIFTASSASRTYQFDFDITSQLNAIPHGGTIYLREGIVIDPDEAIDEDGFDVSVGGWDDIPVFLPPILAEP